MEGVLRVFDKDYLAPILELVELTKGVEQGKKHHPEKDVYSHSLQCADWAFRETIDTDLILAALCHDVGKAVETIGHEQHSVKLCEKYLSAKSLWLIDNHFRVRLMLGGEIKRTKKATDLLTHPWFPELAHLSRIDKLGRNPNVKKFMTSGEIILRLNLCVIDRFEQPEDDFRTGIRR